MIQVCPHSDIPAEILKGVSHRVARSMANGRDHLMDLFYFDRLETCIRWVAIHLCGVELPPPHFSVSAHRVRVSG